VYRKVKRLLCVDFTGSRHLFHAPNDRLENDVEFSVKNPATPSVGFQEFSAPSIAVERLNLDGVDSANCGRPTALVNC
jgi:hypothetical protein